MHFWDRANYIVSSRSKTSIIIQCSFCKSLESEKNIKVTTCYESIAFEGHLDAVIRA